MQAAKLEIVALRAEARLAAQHRLDLQETLRLETQRADALAGKAEAWQGAFLRVKDKVSEISEGLVDWGLGESSLPTTIPAAHHPSSSAAR